MPTFAVWFRPPLFVVQRTIGGMVLNSWHHSVAAATLTSAVVRPLAFLAVVIVSAGAGFEVVLAQLGTAGDGLPSLGQVPQIGLWVAIGVAGGSAVGTALSLVIKSVGDSLLQPWLVNRGHRQRADDVAAKLAVVERDSASLRSRIDHLEADTVSAGAERTRLTQILADLHRKNYELARQILIAVGKLRPGEPDHAEEDDPVIEPGSFHAHPSHGPLVLVVEDEPRASLATREVLGRFGFRVHTVDRLDEALAAIHGVDDLPGCPVPEVVILDLMLPDGDGADVLRAVRDEHLSMRVIVTTGKSEETLGPVLAMRPDGLLHKPFRLRGDLLPLLKGGAPA